MYFKIKRVGINVTIVNSKIQIKIFRFAFILVNLSERLL